jgi:hypothetical protein
MLNAHNAFAVRFLSPVRNRTAVCSRPAESRVFAFHRVAANTPQKRTANALCALSKAPSYPIGDGAAQTVRGDGSPDRAHLYPPLFQLGVERSSKSSCRR